MHTTASSLVAIAQYFWRIRTVNVYLQTKHKLKNVKKCALKLQLTRDKKKINRAINAITEINHLTALNK